MRGVSPIPGVALPTEERYSINANADRTECWWAARPATGKSIVAISLFGISFEQAVKIGLVNEHLAALLSQI